MLSQLEEYKKKKGNSPVKQFLETFCGYNKSLENTVATSGEVCQESKLLSTAFQLRSSIKNPFSYDANPLMRKVLIANADAKRISCINFVRKELGLQEIENVSEALKSNNLELAALLEDYRSGFDMMMKKYREDVTVVILGEKIDFLSFDSPTLWGIIYKQSHQILQMAEIMRKAAASEEEEDTRLMQELSALRLENKVLKELYDASQKCDTASQPVRFDEMMFRDQGTQTDDGVEGEGNQVDTMNATHEDEAGNSSSSSDESSPEENDSDTTLKNEISEDDKTVRAYDSPIDQMVSDDSTSSSTSDSERESLKSRRRRRVRRRSHRALREYHDSSESSD